MRMKTHGWTVCSQTLPLPGQTERRLSSVMPQHHHANQLPSNFKNQMIGKTGQIASPPPMINRVKTQRRGFDSIKCPNEFCKEHIPGSIRTKIIVIKCIPNILLDQRMNDQPHRIRDARILLRSSSLLSPTTAPDHSSSPRRIASVRLSSSESFGSAPSRLSQIIAARSARSSSLSFIT